MSATSLGEIAHVEQGVTPNPAFVVLDAPKKRRIVAVAYGNVGPNLGSPRTQATDSGPNGLSMSFGPLVYTWDAVADHGADEAANVTIQSAEITAPLAAAVDRLGVSGDGPLFAEAILLRGQARDRHPRASQSPIPATNDYVEGWAAGSAASGGGPASVSLGPVTVHPGAYLVAGVVITHVPLASPNHDADFPTPAGWTLLRKMSWDGTVILPVNTTMWAFGRPVAAGGPYSFAGTLAPDTAGTGYNWAAAFVAYRAGRPDHPFLMRHWTSRRILFYADSNSKLVARRFRFADESLFDEAFVDVQVDCSAPGQVEQAAASGMLEGTYLRAGVIRLARSQDHGETWTLTDIPGTGWENQTAAHWKGKLVALGFQDGVWYSQAGILQPDLSYVWSPAPVAITLPGDPSLVPDGAGWLLATPEALELAWNDTDGVWHIAKCQDMGADGVGTWT